MPTSMAPAKTQLSQRQAGQGRAGTEAGQPPTHTEQRRAAQQQRVYAGCPGRMEGRGQQRSAAPAAQREAQRRHRDGAGHNQRQAGVPVADDIEEADDLGGVDHGGNHQPQPEHQPGQQRRQYRHGLKPQQMAGDEDRRHRRSHEHAGCRQGAA